MVHDHGMFSGQCCVWFLIMLVASPGSGGEFGGMDMLVLIGVIGGVPFVNGIGMFYAGRTLVCGVRERAE